MKNFKGTIGLGLILGGFLGMVVCVIAAHVFTWQHTDMTEMRRFLEYPWLTVWCIVDYIGIQVGIWMVRKS